MNRAAVLSCIPLALLFAAACGKIHKKTTPVKSEGSFVLPQEDEAFLDDLSRRAFRYFVEKTNTQNGLTLDRAHTDGSSASGKDTRAASSAATGFGLTALCIGASRQWISPRDAEDRVLAALKFYDEKAENLHGWFYHFVDADTGLRIWNCEVSSIDTALLLAGMLTAKQYFSGNREIARLADKIYQRVDFPWMQNGGQALSMGWKPEEGFNKSRWDTYCELTILYLLGLGSPTHPLPRESWAAWSRPRVTYGSYRFISGAEPLFVHQFSHAWVDFRGKRDGGVDWFENSVIATKANRQMCLDLAARFPGYGPDSWGITASDSKSGYVGWGGPPATPNIDGTVAPCAAGGSLMFTPEIALSALRDMKKRHGERIYGVYGFVDAFNPTTNWVDTDVIGIDVGITLLSAENLRSGGVWRWFMANPEIGRAMEIAGIKEAAAK
ncbi:MAG: glucoamylase family protein [Elusimicrobiales bacterium]|nr:glucoamylase family protein [Elusimicrobiales bacterium]